MAYLKQPLPYARLPLHNRLVMPPLYSAKAMEDGAVSQALLDHYREKTAGGHLGLVIVEHSYIAGDGKAAEHQLSAAEDRCIGPLHTLATEIQKNGSKAVLQLNHAGSYGEESITGTTPVGPSALPNPAKKNAPVPIALEQSGIDAIVQNFTAAAQRGQKAGFDGVELHCAHGYLLNQFLSPLTNRRADRYGGGVYNRIRLHLEIITAIRTALGPDYPLLLRLGAADYMPGGQTLADSILAAKELCRAGIDLLDISGGMCRYTVKDLKEPGYFTPLSRAVKETVSVPVLVTGGVQVPQDAEEILKSGAADLVGVGRALLKDSTWPQRAMETLA